MAFIASAPTSSSRSALTAQARPARTWKAPFSTKNTRADVVREVIAGLLGWLAVVSSVALYAEVFVEKEDVDTNATVELFMVITGISTIAFGVGFNLPFIVAPSILYAVRETSVSIGGHLAAQLVANVAALAIFALPGHRRLTSFVPTALRLGVGCGVSMLVSVLGFRSIGILVEDTFALQPFTWEIAIGLAVITASSVKLPPALVGLKWILVVGVPLSLTMLVYAVIDRSKFRGYSAAASSPLSNWGDSSVGMVDFSELWKAPEIYIFYIIRTWFSIVINISSILLIIIDAVCLEGLRGKLKSSGSLDFSNTIGGTEKFRRMACAIPCLSGIGNLIGVTTQAAFVQSMIMIFAGGKTGLCAVVAGAMFILSAVLWPLLPILSPAHVSGALVVVINLRFFTVVRMIDVTVTSNLVMFGISILLIPLSSEFVDALCIATVLGFLSETGTSWLSRYGTKDNKAAATAGCEPHPQRRLVNTQNTTLETRMVLAKRQGNLSSSCELGLSATSSKKRAPFKTTAGLSEAPFAGLPPGEKPRGGRKTVTASDKPRPASSGRGVVSFGPDTYKPGRTTPKTIRTPPSPFHEQEWVAPRGRSGSVRSLPASVAEPSSKLTSRPIGIFPQSAALVSGDSDMSGREVKESDGGRAVEKTTTYRHESQEDEHRSVHWGLALIATSELVLTVIRDETQS